MTSRRRQWLRVPLPIWERSGSILKGDLPPAPNRRFSGRCLARHHQNLNVVALNFARAKAPSEGGWLSGAFFLRLGALIPLPIEGLNRGYPDHTLSPIRPLLQSVSSDFRKDRTREFSTTDCSLRGTRVPHFVGSGDCDTPCASLLPGGDRSPHSFTCQHDAGKTPPPRTFSLVRVWNLGRGRGALSPLPPFLSESPSTAR